MPGVGAFGPYRRGRKWRVVVRAGDGASVTESFATEAAARRYKLAASVEVTTERQGERTVSDAITEYAKHLAAKGNRASSLAETPRRLRWILGPDLDEPIAHLTPARAKWLYQRIETATYQRDGEARRYSVDTCRNVLAEARSFLAWCVGGKWLRANPLDGVKGQGKRKHGKAQLTIDEARRWSAEAMRLATGGDAGAVAALVTVTLGLRASEIVGRKVRDLDDEGRLLRVTTSKTAAGVRAVEVPDALRPILAQLAADREPDAMLFGEHWRDWVRKQVRRICVGAKVSIVTAHGMRGLHASLAMAAGATSRLVAAALGHESPTTTIQSYAAPGTVEAATQRTALVVLSGGKR